MPPPAARILTRGWLVACDGQHRDLTLTTDGPDPLGAALLAAERKTAGPTAAAVEAGAVAGGADPALAAAYRRFGASIGMAGQLANDLAGLLPGPGGATDVSSGRLTVPICFALRAGASPALRACFEARRAGISADATTHALALAELEAAGAHRFAWALARAARREATRILDEIARRRPVRGTLDALLPATAAGAGRAA